MTAIPIRSERRTNLE